jgi:hypothetical protein
MEGYPLRLTRTPCASTRVVGDKLSWPAVRIDTVGHTCERARLKWATTQNSVGTAHQNAPPLYWSQWKLETLTPLGMGIGTFI